MRFLDLLIRLIARFNDGAGRVAKVLSLSLIGLMTFVILYQVFFRYVLNAAPSWSEEVARSLMVWMTFAVAPLAYRLGANVALETFLRMFGGRLLILLEIVIHLLVMAFIVVFFERSLDFVERGANIRATTFPLQMNYVYAILPVSFAVMFTVGLEHLLTRARRLIDPSGTDLPDRRASHAPVVD